MSLQFVPIKMETDNALVQQYESHNVPFPPSSSSDTAMLSEAGGDPWQLATRGGTDPSFALHLELRDEITQLQRSYQQEIHVSSLRYQELHTRYNNQAWRAIQYQHQCFREDAQHYEQVSEEYTEAAVARERSVQQAAQQQQLNGYQTALIRVEGQIQQHEYMLQEAQIAHAEALQEQYSDALAEQRATMVTEAESALAQEKIKQKQLKAEYMRSLTKTHAAADANLQQAYETIQGLQETIQRQELSHAELHGRLHSMQTAIEKSKYSY